MSALSAGTAGLLLGVYSPEADAATSKRRWMSTKTLQAWLTKAGDSQDKIVILPAGNYLVENSLYVPPGVIIVGEHERAPYGTRNFPISNPSPMTEDREVSDFYVGTTFLVTATDGPALLFGGDGCEVHGCTFYYPEQSAAAPRYYPPTITAATTQEFVLGLAIRNNLFVNSWDAIKLGSPGLSKMGQVLIDGNQGQVINTGIDLGQVLDLVTVRDTHFWPFWSGQVGHINSVGLRCYQSDWLQVEDFFSYAMRVGVQLLNDESGRSCSGTFHRINVDACDVGVDVYSLAEWGVTFRDLNVVCAETNPLGGAHSYRYGIWGHSGDPSPRLENSSFKLDGFRVEGSATDIRWEHQAPLVKSNITI